MSDQTSPPAPASPGAGVPAGQPFCSVCGYQLTGATEASKCPECGTPLVECLVRAQYGFRAGKPVRYTSPVTLFGLPILQVSLGPNPATGERRGRARAIVAVGDVAIGGIACGGFTMGVVSLGGFSVGVCSLGGFALGALTAAGGFAAGTGMSAGGMAVGALSVGGFSVGYGAAGGFAVGYHALGGNAAGAHVTTATGGGDPAAAAFFQKARWFFGTNPIPGGATMLGGAQPAAVVLGIDVLLAATILALAMWAKFTRGRADPFVR